jgi:protein gp37
VSQLSSIEWTDATWNPVRGCTKISPGCKNCYAKTFAERFRGVPGHPYEQGFDLRLVPEKLFEPLKWKRPKKIFVNSMSDLFHPDVPDEFIVRVAEVMIQGDWHNYQVLTKRAERLETLLNSKLKFATVSSHIWWGVSVEDRLLRLRKLTTTTSCFWPYRWQRPMRCSMRALQLTCHEFGAEYRTQSLSHRRSTTRIITLASNNDICTIYSYRDRRSVRLRPGQLRPIGPAER